MLDSLANLIRGLWKKLVTRETVLYVVFGVVTTIINFVVYYILRHLGVNYLVANTIAWIAAVSAAYVTNKLWVFNSRSWAFPVVFREVILFAAARLLSLAAETAFMALTVELLHANDRVMKIIAEIFVVILNYIFSKLVIFRKKE